MNEFINGDCFVREHSNGFTLNLKGKIVYTKILIQIMPLINDGLSYVIFFKKLMYHKKIIGIRDMCDVVYQSESFDEFVSAKLGSYSLMSYITPEIQLQLLNQQNA